MVKRLFTLPSATDRQRLAQLAERLSRPLGVLLSLVLLVVVLRQAREADWSVLARSTGLTAAFWTTLAAYYLLSPLAEWAIYTRLWGFDPKAFPALLRKLVCNELLLDYLGDVQFLAWARTHHAGAVAPFAAVKDVTVLSALTGNLVTLVLAVLAWPLVGSSLSSVSLKTIVISLCVVVAGSSLVLLLGKRIFSHPPRTLLWIAAVLVLRTLGGLALAAVLWHLLMPASALSQLFLLATLRMVVSRLPLIPSKELLFAGLAVMVFGRTADISEASAIIATLVLLIHIVVGAVLTAVHLGLAPARAANARGNGAPPDPGG